MRRNMPNTIIRFPKSPVLTGLAVMTRCVEYGFLTAGATVAAFSALQSAVIVSTWMKAF
jgi:hypothetical protein